MTTVDIEEAEEQIASLVERVEAGEGILYVRDGTTVARMVAFAPERRVRELGNMRGRIILHPGWDDPEDWDEFLDDPNDPLNWKDGVPPVAVHPID